MAEGGVGDARLAHAIGLKSFEPKRCRLLQR
jgi:hypothetical protein